MRERMMKGVLQVRCSAGVGLASFREAVRSLWRSASRWRLLSIGMYVAHCLGEYIVMQAYVSMLAAVDACKLCF